MAALSDTSADPARLRLRSVLATQELCVCDLATALKISESAVFHQLHLLRSQRFVKYRQGHKVHYSLVDSHVINLSRERRTTLTKLIHATMKPVLQPHVSSVAL